MPKMKFNTRVKYKGAIFGGLEVFEVDDQDVKEMQARGGVVVVENNTKTKEQEQNKEQEKKEDQKRVKKK